MFPKGDTMITAKQYTEAYVAYRTQLRENAERISKSSECRKYLIKNTDSAPWSDLLKVAVECIADLTGDECFRKQVLEKIEGRTPKE